MSLYCEHCLTEAIGGIHLTIHHFRKHGIHTASSRQLAELLGLSGTVSVDDTAKAAVKELTYLRSIVYNMNRGDL